MYNSQAFIGFSVKHAGPEPTVEELETALLRRVADIYRTGEIEEAVDYLEDEFAIEEDDE